MYKLKEYNIIDNPFDYKYLDAEIIEKYQFFADQFEKLYEEKNERYNLTDCFFYIRDDISCNAFARNKRGYNIIGITKGYAVQMLEAFDEKIISNNSINKLIESNNGSISSGYKKLLKTNDFSVSKFMLNCSNQFTFGHEFQHILQFNSSKIIVENYISENIDLSNFCIKRHAWELDADFFATWDVFGYILNVKNGYYFKNKQDINENAFICLLFLGIGSICITKTFSYFGKWNYKNDIKKINFYTKKHSHPHPLVRILHILDSYHDQIKDSFPSLKIDKQGLLNNVMLLMEIYFKTQSPNKKILSSFFKDIDRYLNIANEYKDELYDIAIKDEAIRTLLNKRNIKFKE